jgi:formamidopyrimidine-DNA glycosylase
MPELPEIEHLTRDLRPRLLGRRVEDVVCRQPKMLNLPPEEFAARASGRISEITRRGKSCLLLLEEGGIWLHLGLGGEIKVTPRDAAEPQLALELDGGERLIVDKTFMGRAHYFEGEDHIRRCSELGPEPLADDFTVDVLQGILRSKGKQALKALLMDQARVAGIGNTYSDEVLHAARLHPRRQAGSLTPKEVERLHGALRVVLLEATAAGGEESFVDTRGRHGRYEMHIHGAEACRDCGTAAQRATIGGRTAYFCPSCQAE